MELITVNSVENQIISDKEIITTNNKSSFIEANTNSVSLEHLKKDCIIPVFSKDNEMTISHHQFVNTVFNQVKSLLNEPNLKQPEIRVSHIVKGRIPSAIGKPVKELLDNERTIYYERCAFVIEIPQITRVVNGNKLSMAVGGVRSLAQENLYSKKSLEKFKIFLGFQNQICLNLCISTDGLLNSIRIGSIRELAHQVEALFGSYNEDVHLDTMGRMLNYKLSEKQFAHFIGKTRMYQHLDKTEQKSLFPITLNDSQINHVVKQYYNCSNFGRNVDGSINIWNLYNLCTGANKSSYIDFNLERNINAYELMDNLGNSLHNGEQNWLLASL